MIASDPRPLLDETEGEGRQMSPVSALGRRGLIQGSAATVVGSIVMPAGSRAEAAIPQPIATIGTAATAWRSSLPTMSRQAV